MLLNKKSNLVAFGGIATAVALICLFVTSVFQFSKLALCFGSSVICGVMVVSFGYKTSLIHYLAVAILSVLFVPDKTVAVLYVVVFGNYPIIRFFLDGIKNALTKNFIKFILFNMYLILIFLITNFILNIDIIKSLKYSVWFVWTAMILLLFLYDYIYMPFVRKVYSLLNKK